MGPLDMVRNVSNINYLDAIETGISRNNLIVRRGCLASTRIVENLAATELIGRMPLGVNPKYDIVWSLEWRTHYVNHFPISIMNG